MCNIYIYQITRYLRTGGIVIYTSGPQDITEDIRYLIANIAIKRRSMKKKNWLGKCVTVKCISPVFVALVYYYEISFSHKIIYRCMQSSKITSPL